MPGQFLEPGTDSETSYGGSTLSIDVGGQTNHVVEEGQRQDIELQEPVQTRRHSVAGQKTVTVTHKVPQTEVLRRSVSDENRVRSEKTIPLTRTERQQYACDGLLWECEVSFQNTQPRDLAGGNLDPLTCPT